MARRKAPRIPDAILDQLLAGADPKTAFEADGLLDELKKALAERALNAEIPRMRWTRPIAPSVVIFSGRGRPRGEARGLGCKPRRAAFIRALPI